MQSGPARPGVFYGWWIVAVSSLIMLFAGGITHFGFTAVFEPIAKEFNWSYTAISLAASIRGLETGLLAPVVGMLVDRWGPRKTVFGGVVIMGAGLILLSRISSLGMFYAAFVLIAMGISSTGHASMMTAVANWFRRRVAVATGIMASGAALGGLMIPVVVLLTDRFDWRTAMFILGLATWAVCLPLSLLLRDRPERYGFLPDGERLTVAPAAEVRPGAGGAAVRIPAGQAPSIGSRQALRQRAFWHIALSLTFQLMAVSAVITHVMPYLSSIGVSRSLATVIATALPLSSVAGRLGFGWMGDRFDKKRVSAAGFALTGLGMVFFSAIAGGGVWMLALFLVFFGTGWGGNVTMRAALIRDYFGRESFGAIHGLAMAVMTVGTIAGAPFVGWVYDRWQSYQGAWFGMAALSALAVLTVVTTPRPVETT